ncbi:MAG: hypothetical protein AAFN51_09715 [Pseudomonadota bacterium]
MICARLKKLDVSQDLDALTAIGDRNRSLGFVVRTTGAALEARDDLPSDLSESLRSLLLEIDEDRVWRNLALHSAWFRSGENYKPHGYYRVKPDGDKRRIDDWQAFNAEVSLNDLDSASMTATDYISRAAKISELIVA